LKHLKEMEEFSKRLKIAREKSGYSQVELAKKADISKSMVFAYENGECDLRSSTANKLAKILGVDLSWLLGADEPRMIIDCTNLSVTKRDLLEFIVNAKEEQVERYKRLLEIIVIEK
jgi:transcriptional regulator with XRE-family HTH domain